MIKKIVSMFFAIGIVLIVIGVGFNILDKPEHVCTNTCKTFEMTYVDYIIRNNETYCECTSAEQKYLIVEAIE